MEKVPIETYNRINEWMNALRDTQHALNLCDYLNKELFSKEETEKCVPHDIAIYSHKISFEIPAIYYMRVFNCAAGSKGRMNSNYDKKK